MRQLAALVAVILVAACQPEITADVMLVTDSVSAQAGEEITKEFSVVSTADGGRYIASMGSSVGGQGLTYVHGVPLDKMDAFWAAHLTSLIDRGQPDLLLVELGYNDCPRLDGYASRVDSFMANTADLPTYWLTLADQGDRWNGGHCDDTINAVLTAAQADWPNLHLLDYRSWALAHPEHYADAVHLNATGQIAYADWLKAQLDAL